MLPEAYTSNIVQVMTNDVCVKNMAALGSATNSDFDPHQIPKVVGKTSDSLIYLDLKCLNNRQLSQLDHSVLAVLRQAMLDKNIDELQIVIDARDSFTATRKSLKQFWKRKKTFADFDL